MNTLPKEIEEAIRNLIRDADSEFAGGSQATLEAAIVAYEEEARREALKSAAEHVRRYESGDGWHRAVAVEIEALASPSSVEGDAAKCATCGGTGLVESRTFVPDAPGWAPESKPCPACPPVEGDGARAEMHAAGRDTNGARYLEEAEKARLAEARLAMIQSLLDTWKRNRADPKYGSGAPSPLYAVGMASEADSMIKGLEEALQGTTS